MTNVQTRKLSFKFNFNLYPIKCTFDITPKIEKPLSIHDYEVDKVDIYTFGNRINIYELLKDWESISFKVQKEITAKGHRMYMDRLNEQFKKHKLYS